MPEETASQVYLASPLRQLDAVAIGIGHNGSQTPRTLVYSALVTRIFDLPASVKSAEVPVCRFEMMKDDVLLGNDESRDLLVYNSDCSRARGPIAPLTDCATECLVQCFNQFGCV